MGGGRLKIRAASLQGGPVERVACVEATEMQGLPADRRVCEQGSSQRARSHAGKQLPRPPGLATGQHRMGKDARCTIRFQQDIAHLRQLPGRDAQQGAFVGAGLGQLLAQDMNGEMSTMRLQPRCQ